MKIQKQFYSLLLVLFSYFLVTSTITATDDNKNNETTINDVKKETSEAVEAIKLYSFNQRDEMLKKSKLYLEKLDARIDLLEETVDREWDNMNAHSRKQARELIKDLQKERVELAELMGELKNSTLDTWNDIQDNFSKTYLSLSLATENAVKQFEPVKKSNMTLIYIHILTAVVITLILFFIFLLLKRTGPWKSKWVFFVLLFLFTWVGGIWLAPFGPMIAGVAIVPFVYFGILFCLILASIQPKETEIIQDKKSKKMAEVDVYDNAMMFAVLDLFFWILFIFLLIALIAHYLK